jgi:hypothetical protein
MIGYFHCNKVSLNWARLIHIMLVILIVCSILRLFYDLLDVKAFSTIYWILHISYGLLKAHISYSLLDVKAFSMAFNMDLLL